MSQSFVPLISAVIIIALGIVFAYFTATEIFSYGTMDVLSGFVLTASLVAIYIFIASQTHEQAQLINQQKEISEQLKEIQKAEYLPAIRVTEYHISNDIIELSCMNVLRGPAIDMRLRTEIVFPERHNNPTLRDIPMTNEEGEKIATFDVTSADVPLTRTETTGSTVSGDVLEGQESDIFQARPKVSCKNFEEIVSGTIHPQYIQQFEQEDGKLVSFSLFLEMISDADINKLGIRFKVVYEGVSQIQNSDSEQVIDSFGGNPKEAGDLQEFTELPWNTSYHQSPDGDGYWIISRDPSNP